MTKNQAGSLAFAQSWINMCLFICMFAGLIAPFIAIPLAIVLYALRQHIIKHG